MSRTLQTIHRQEALGLRGDDALLLAGSCIGSGYRFDLEANWFF